MLWTIFTVWLSLFGIGAVVCVLVKIFRVGEGKATPYVDPKVHTSGDPYKLLARRHAAR